MQSLVTLYRSKLTSLLSYRIIMLQFVERLLVVLRDGRTMIGYLRSVDQFGESANLKISKTSSVCEWLIIIVSSHSESPPSRHSGTNTRWQEIRWHSKRDLPHQRRERGTLWRNCKSSVYLYASAVNCQINHQNNYIVKCHNLKLITSSCPNTAISLPNQKLARDV